MDNNKETIKIEFNTELLDRLSSTFVELTPKSFKKLLFILFLINKGKFNKKTSTHDVGYELSVKHLKSYLSLNSQLAQILNKLQAENIIKKIGGYTSGINYQKYAMVTPWNLQEKKTNTDIYLVDADGVYVRRFIKDNYIVRYDLPAPAKSKVIDNHDKEIISSQKLEIETLKNRIAELEAKLSQSSNSDNIEQIEEIPVKEDEEIQAFETPETIVHHEEFDSLKNIEFDDFFAPAKPVIKAEPTNVPDGLKSHYEEVRQLMSEGMMEYKALDKVCKDDHKLRFDISKYLRTA